MSFNPDSDEVFNKKLSVYAEEKSSHQFCKQMSDALVNLGTKETLSCMARFMVAIASDQGIAIEFDCDLGKVQVEPVQIPQRH